MSYLPDLNDKIRAGDAKKFILLSEALHEKKVAEIADCITRRNKRLILIAGPSSSGKTTFAKRLCVQLMGKIFNGFGYVTNRWSYGFAF